MTPAEFKTQFPEFSSETDLRVQSFIDRAAPYFDVDRWDNLYSEGVAYFVAHNIAMANAVAATPAITTNDISGPETGRNKKVGDVAVQVNRSESILSRQTENPFLRTLYGQQYIYLRRMAGMGAFSC